MDCGIKPYIKSLTSNKEVQTELNKIHNDIFKEIYDSKLFRLFKNKLYEKMQEEVSLGFGLDSSCIHDRIVEKVCDLAGEYFRAVILANKSVMLCFEEESCQVLGL